MVDLSTVMYSYVSLPEGKTSFKLRNKNSPSKVSEFPTIRMLWKIVHCLNGGVPLITDDLDDDLLGTPHDLDVEAPNAFNTWPATQQLS